jgi:hypothetical protein
MQSTKDGFPHTNLIKEKLSKTRYNLRTNKNKMSLSNEAQLGCALEAFGYAHQMEVGWSTTTLEFLMLAGITSIAELSTGCKDDTVNLDLELFGAPTECRLSKSTIKNLDWFLPGPKGCRCFSLAQRISQHVETGRAETEYVHRPENGKIGEEKWKIGVGGETWVVNVDCAGFIRNVLKHTTKNPFVMALSDRDFMRAKDFYDFFSTIPFTVLNPQPFPEGSRLMKWRTVPDLRLVMPGDVIVYRPRGNAAGGAAFTTNDRKDLRHILKAVKTAQVWHSVRSSGALVTKNAAKDPQVRAWVDAVKTKLNAIGIFTANDCYNNIGSINDKLAAGGYLQLDLSTLALMTQCCETTVSNTGHIVFASGPALNMGDGIYRIRVVHSTKFGKKDQDGEVTTGVQEYFRRFSFIEDADGRPYWTRGVVKAANPVTAGNGGQNINDEDDNPKDDMEEEDDEDDDLPNPNDASREVVPEEDAPPTDELSGCSQVDVIAARMCF